MKRLRHLWILILLFGLVSMSACGKPEEEPASQEAAVNYAETVAAHQNLLVKHRELEMLYERTKAREAEYIVAVNTLTNENLALRTELAIVKGLEGERKYEDLLDELLELQAEKINWAFLTKLDYEELTEKYNRLDALFPPTYFPDEKELVKWRASTGNATELDCLGLQSRAAADGYIVSVHPELDYCVAIAGGYWYKIIPGDQALVEKIRRVE